MDFTFHTGIRERTPVANRQVEGEGKVLDGQVRNRHEGTLVTPILQGQSDRASTVILALLVGRWARCGADVWYVHLWAL